MPDTAYKVNQTQQQTKLNSKPNIEHTERNTENTERQRFLSIYKKKNPQYTNKNQTPANHSHVAATPQLARRRRRRLPLIADRRSASAPVLPPALPQGISLFFSLSLSHCH